MKKILIICILITLTVSGCTSTRVSTETGTPKTKQAQAQSILASTGVLITSQTLKDNIDVGNISNVKLLLDAGLDINQIMTNYSPLQEAAYSGQEAILEELLLRGANIEGKSDLGMTALMVATNFSQTAIIQLLLEKGANVNAHDDSMNTALILAVYRGHSNIVKLLLDKGADPSLKQMLRNQTALMIAKEAKKQDIVALLEAKMTPEQITQKADPLRLPAEVKNYIQNIIQLDSGMMKNLNNFSKGVNLQDYNSALIQAKDMANMKPPSHYEYVQKAFIEMNNDINQIEEPLKKYFSTNNQTYLDSLSDLFKNVIKKRNTAMQYLSKDIENIDN